MLERLIILNNKSVQDEASMTSDLEIALKTVNDREDTLKLLLETEPKVAVVTPLLSTIMEIAIESSNLNAIALARSVLYNYSSDPLVRSNIQIFAASYFSGNDEWHYRRIAELYKLLKYEEEFTSFISLCQASNNWEIKEIADDFRNLKE